MCQGDHYWLVRRGGTCADCGKVFAGNFKDVHKVVPSPRLCTEGHRHEVELWTLPAASEGRNSLTYGTLPAREAFEARFERIVGPIGDEGEGATYALGLKGRDASAAEGAGFMAHERLTCAQLWRLVENLVRAWENIPPKRGAPLSEEESSAAGDLASAILSTLEFEWI